MSPNAALHFHPADYGWTKKSITGRLSATRGFLDAFLRHADIDEACCFAEKEAHFDVFQEQVSAIGRELSTKFISFDHAKRIGTVGCLYRPDPGIRSAAWQRRMLANARDYSVCGVIHASSSARVLDAIGDLLIAPVQPWDALVCPSQAVKEVVVRVAEDWREYLASRLGTALKSPVELPVIPLGVDAESFAANSRKGGVPNRLADYVADDEFVVLYVGRLSHTRKAHPLPMFLSLEQVAKATDRKIHLLLVGWFGNDKAAEEFQDLGTWSAPHIRLTALNGRKPNLVQAAWRTADVFVSLSDNIQESFGLTPIEAMAAGVPAIVSDWNGYRDTIRHGVDGFRVPTTLPPSGSGRSLANQYGNELISYEQYIGSAAQCCAISIDTCAQYLSELIRNPELRRRMGEAGQGRAKQVYDWSHVIHQYQELWGRLAEIRATADEVAPPVANHPSHPLRNDPFATFGHFATNALDDATTIVATEQPEPDYLRRLQSHKLSDNTGRIMANQECIEAILQHEAEITLRELSSELSVSASELYRTVAWMIKCGLVREVPSPDVVGE